MYSQRPQLVEGNEAFACQARGQASRRSAVELRSRFTRVIVHTDLHVTVKVTIVAVVTA